ncbi:sodium/potassium/calcium exchanger 1-like [Jatropha curcas]|uniref:sodium/potassium/calcium exchanger 1-like n=1 Tax=Jatropha curcas TaxID=180498 RepID=UPI0005FBE2D4|nr:sodium/potassium/calcium exchanger 1-like [Jatropha curcas]
MSYDIGGDNVSNEDGVGFQETEFDVGEAPSVFETEVGSNNPEAQSNENVIGSNNEIKVESNNRNSSPASEVGTKRSIIGNKTEDGEYEGIEVDPNYQSGNEELHSARERVKNFFSDRGSTDDKDSIGDEEEGEEQNEDEGEEQNVDEGEAADDRHVSEVSANEWWQGNVGEGDDSNDEGEVEELLGDEGHRNLRRKPKKRVEYNPNCQFPAFAVRMVFKNAT